MSYQVLARSWRPRSFNALEGQEHVLKALQNALEHSRLHHAYLFSGTRGVGKTTIARILAKCLNCETGVTATPCGQCDACVEIDEGRFVDLIEVDAASRTKVEDTRELLNNVQYAPTRGRFKIYLIDEVHMLSGHSFNALLKTLEEPPEHVKFLLATTDPQKLPVTVLSRCLQFHLKNLSAERIAAYIADRLTQEKIPFDQAALIDIGQAARGSMRDALSILDQAISFTNQNLTAHEVSAMLGTFSKTHIESLLRQLADQNGQGMLDVVEQCMEQGADSGQILDELMSILHQIAVVQLVPEARAEDHIIALSQLLSSEDVQLYYQIALNGRRDMAYAVNDRSALEMTLLRMLAFHPMQEVSLPTPQKSSGIEPKVSAGKISVTPVQAKPQSTSPVNNGSDATALLQKDWGAFVQTLNLKGLAQALALNCVLKEATDQSIELQLGESHAAFLNESLKTRLSDRINQTLNKTVQLKISVGQPAAETPAEKKERLATEAHAKAVETLENDPNVQQIKRDFDVSLDPNLVTLKNE